VSGLEIPSAYEPVNLDSSDADQTIPQRGSMLHCEQSAVRHPRFPGNVEALSVPPSLPEHRFSHQSPSSSPSSSSSSSFTATTTPLRPPEWTATSQERTPGPNQSSKPKRRQTPAACRSCRQRKSRVCASSAARKQVEEYACCMFPS
jgi:hypothetical protein